MVVDQSRRRCLLCNTSFTGRAFVCRPCADRYRKREIPDEVLRRFYSRIDDEYPEWANTYGNYNPPRSLLSYLEQFGREISVLEVGAGGGFLLESLWQRGFRCLTGSDITVTALAEMSRRTANFTVVGADAESLPFRDGTFDVVISSDVIEHLTRPINHLRDVHRVLKPGGRYLLKTPNRRPAELYYRIRGLYDYHIWHPSMFAPGELCRTIDEVGFDIEFLPVAELTAAQIRKIPTEIGKTVLTRAPVHRLPVVLHPHLEAVATRRCATTRSQMVLDSDEGE
jgi:SAM-dependent methyltransferase